MRSKSFTASFASFASVALWTATAVCTAIMVNSDAVHAATPADSGAHMVYGTLWQRPIVLKAPCALTLIGPASEAENCMGVNRRTGAGPALDVASGIIVVGVGNAVEGLSVINGKRKYHTPLTGNVVSSPTLLDGSAFLGTDDAMLYHVDITTGEILWNTEIDAEVTEPPFVVGDLVVVTSGIDTAYGIDRKTGTIIWSRKHPLPSGITLRGSARPTSFVTTTADGSSQTRLYVGTASGHLLVLDAKDGSLLHQINLGAGRPFADIDADLLALNQKTVVAASHASGVYALDSQTLAEQWRIDEEGVVRMAKVGTGILVLARAGELIAYDVAHFDAGKPRETWRLKYGKGAPTRLTVQGGRIHFASDKGALMVVDAFSGKLLQTYGSNLGFAADVFVADELLLALSNPGSLFVMSGSHKGPVSQTVAPRHPFRSF